MVDPLRRLPEPVAVLLDWDNTLVSSWQTIRDAMNVTLNHFGLEPWSMEHIRTRVRKSARDSFPTIFGNKWQAASDVFYTRFREIHIERLTVLPGAEDLLEGLSVAGIPVGIVSNKNGACLRAEIDHLGWRDRLYGIVGANDARQDKPAAAPVILALRGSGIVPNPQVWFAGDADIDLQCARNAGVCGILIRAEPASPGEFPDAPPHAHVPDCRAFLELVRNSIECIGNRPALP